MRSALVLALLAAVAPASAQTLTLIAQAERAAWAAADDALTATSDALDAPDPAAALRAAEHAASARTLFDVVAALRAERGDAVPRCRDEARAVGAMDEVSLAAVSVLLGGDPPEAARLAAGRELVGIRASAPELVCDATLGPPAPPAAGDAHGGHGHDHSHDGHRHE